MNYNTKKKEKITTIVTIEHKNKYKRHNRIQERKIERTQLEISNRD